ncbi:alpha-ketoglutarate-dependent dioxygenase AlkB family protein [Prochlorococcus marinus]|uniref:Alkylated DNA repair protein n=1 Tax=Prochlorococcus marinus (strain MIT 9211) TaxID=93059 RepID=A9BA22_PROM4|nr:alpha-ketoglutarate-dependent dioxygenase AlkB [Prochlorococcus marinus]ABX08684.1 Alkylated DNA repair protein [Prochlorococcus marinus str. MIT 9211]
MKSLSNTEWSYFPALISHNQTGYWKNIILENLEWTQPVVKVYSKRYSVPRLTAFLGSKGISYKYSGAIHYAEDWPKWFFPLLDYIRDFSRTNYNGCLINLYRDGNDCMGWHSDNEKELDPKKSIASLSLGATRDFFFRSLIDSSSNNIELRDGDLLLMHPECQFNWKHCLPKRKKVSEVRINLTFRCYR